MRELPSADTSTTAAFVGREPDRLAGAGLTRVDERGLVWIGGAAFDRKLDASFIARAAGDLMSSPFSSCAMSHHRLIAVLDPRDRGTHSVTKRPPARAGPGWGDPEGGDLRAPEQTPKGDRGWTPLGGWTDVRWVKMVRTGPLWEPLLS